MAHKRCNPQLIHDVDKDGCPVELSSLSELKSRLQGGLSDGVAGWELGNSEWNTLYILKDMFRTADYSLIIR